MSRSRNYCFTLNNYTIKNVQDIMEAAEECKYIIFGKEVGEQGTPHLQGYVEFNEGKSLEAVKKIFNCKKLHLEVRKGTAKQAADYCKKEDKNYFEEGEISKQGKRSDLEEVIEYLFNGNSLSDVARNYPIQWIKYNKGIKDLFFQKQEHRKEKPRIEWIYGKTGVGKTKYATELCNGDIYVKDVTQWWDGYEHQKVILIDDYNGKWPFRDLLRLLDRYPYQGQTKGGYIKINSTHIIITCDRRPEDLYKGILSEDELSQLLRRFDTIKEITAPPSIGTPSEWVPQMTTSTEVAGNTTPPQNYIIDFLENHLYINPYDLFDYDI